MEIEDQGAARPAVKKNEVPPENAETAKKKVHKLLSLCYLRSVAAKILLELRDIFLQWYR
jgi:hypothetical protein